MENWTKHKDNFFEKLIDVDKKEGREMIIPTEKVMAYHDYLSVIYGGIPIGLSKKVEVLSNELNHCYHLSNL